MKHLILSASALCLLIAVAPVAANAADGSYSATTSVKEDADGNMKKEVKEESTNAAGTKSVSTSKEKVVVDKDGDTKIEVTTKDVIDPKGMLNKSETVTKETVKTEADGDSKSDSVTKSTTAGGTTDKVETKATVKHGKHGRKTVKETTSVHDPKGMMNKEVAKTTDTTEAKEDGTVEINHKETVNGKTVEETKVETK
ncbi:MAG: hypothetical protein JWO78_992 [Micavibrio sp.]|nr:hypothetical protein [Micavibrio sp.]